MVLPGGALGVPRPVQLVPVQASITVAAGHS